MSDTACTAARRAIEQRNFIGWRGLPPDCQPRELFPNLPADLQGRPVRYLGEEFRDAVFVPLPLEGYYRPMASFDGDRLILFDGMNPELAGGFAPLKADLGNPAARLDWYYGTLKIADGEWVYPERGITVFLAPEVEQALHIALYQPTTLDDYLKNLRPHLRKTLSRKTV
jgi:hypothetical protein